MIAAEPKRRRGGPRGIDWSAVPNLGKVADVVIAGRLGCSQQAVQLARKAAGIPPFRHVRPMNRSVDWSKVEGMGERSDGELAQELGVSKSTVAWQRKKAGIAGAPRSRVPESELGQRPDVEIAREAGVHRASVSHMRRVRGIPRYQRIDWSKVDLARPTRDLVAELGCSRRALFDQRRLRGISIERGHRPIGPEIARARDAALTLIAAGMGRFQAAKRVAAARGVRLSTLRASLQRSKKGKAA